MPASDPEENLYLALDQGGHASRAIVMDNRGNTVADEFVEIQTMRAREFHVEHSARELSDSLNQCCKKIADTLGDRVRNIKSAGLATQRSSIVCWQKDSGLPLTRVLSWQDRRAHEFIEARLANSSEVEKITGLVMSPHYGASKINWCLVNDDNVQSAYRDKNLIAGPLAQADVTRAQACYRPICEDAMPLIGSLYLAMTWHSAIRYWCGSGSNWKGRHYGRAPDGSTEAELNSARKRSAP